MTARQELIRQAFQKFQSTVRLIRWQAIDETLGNAGLPELTGAERDAVDMAAALGMPPELPAERGTVAADAGETQAQSCCQGVGCLGCGGEG